MTWQAGVNLGFLWWTIGTIVGHGILSDFVASDVCNTLDGGSLLFDGIVLLFLLSEHYYPMERQSRDSSCCCSWASLLMAFGAYTSVIIGVSALPGHADWNDDNKRCMPEWLIYLLFVYTISATLHILVITIRATLANCIPRHWLARQNPPLLAPASLSQRQLDTIITVHVWPPLATPASPPSPPPRPTAPEALAPPLTTTTTTATAKQRVAIEIPMCAICLDRCVGLVKRLPCGHEFHAGCIDQWLLRQNQCALCRQPAVTV